MIRPPTCWQLIAYLIGWLLGWLGSTAYPAGWDDVAVRVTNQRGPIADLGSGTIVAGNGQTALVVTCQHIFREGAGQIAVERPDHQRYPARLLGVSRLNDIAAVEIPDPGVRTLKIADRQASAATLIGWGSTNRAWKHRGQLVEQDRDTVFYSFNPIEGDSGGGVFDDAGSLMGVAWGTDGSHGATVPLADLRETLASPTLKRYWPTASTTFQSTSPTGRRPDDSTTKAGPMIPLILAAGMLAQSPPLPGKNAPLSVQPSAQGQTFAPQQSYDVPIGIRLKIIPEVQTYAPQPQARESISYGGGCYGGSYSGGFSASYQQTYAAPAARVCPGGFCGLGARSSSYSAFGGAKNKIKIKNRIQVGGGAGLRALLGE